MIKEHRHWIMIALIALSLAMYDVMIDLVFNVLHMIFEIIHILYEWFELGIEHAVEHLFHTSRHGSQIITFYILLGIASLLIMGVWWVIPRVYQQGLQWVSQAWDNRKVEYRSYWQSLSLISKVSLLSKTTGIVWLTSFLVM